MESEIEELKVKLKETHVQLEAESQQRAQVWIGKNMNKKESKSQMPFLKVKTNYR